MLGYALKMTVTILKQKFRFKITFRGDKCNMIFINFEVCIMYLRRWTLLEIFTTPPVRNIYILYKVLYGQH